MLCLFHVSETKNECQNIPLFYWILGMGEWDPFTYEFPVQHLDNVQLEKLRCEKRQVFHHT